MPIFITDIASHPKLSFTLFGFIIDLQLDYVTSKNRWQQEALPSVTKLSEVSMVKNLFRLGCHLMKANNYRLIRDQYMESTVIPSHYLVNVLLSKKSVYTVQKCNVIGTNLAKNVKCVSLVNVSEY
ncbi:MAG: hypothetical protein ACI9IT_002663 [Glaciecola sp.]|jgi:hypothetical protein